MLPWSMEDGAHLVVACRSLVSSPTADVMPGCGGTSTSGISSMSATSAACSGPAPPNATSANSRGSCPFSIVRDRIARAMFELAIVRIPSAVSRTPMPSCSARRSTAACGGVAVQLHAPAEEPLGVDPAEHHVRVRDRRLRAALAVAGRARVGPGAARADAKRAAVVDAGDRAAAGADRVDVEHRHEQRVAAHPRVARDASPMPCSVTMPMSARRAAHVERDQPPPAGERAGPLAAEHAGGRPRQQQCHRALGCRCSRWRRRRCDTSRAARRERPAARARCEALQVPARSSGRRRRSSPWS